jgi:hypothetical protein
MSKRMTVQNHIRKTLADASRLANQNKKYLKIQEQFRERSNKRFEGKRVMVEDVIKELSDEWCLSVARIEKIIRMKLD